ncbi:hypothetical protein VE02_01164 [Pseudogymnoascus sp. 03VT05]|nr:hypothetical protein VE02_01164 [Pseudogymnoascus sp. 03VT05]
MGSFRSSAPDLNPKDGFLTDFMAGGKQHRRKSGTIQRCAFGEGCRKLVTSKNMGTVPLPRPSDFCDIHTCIGFQGEAPCFNKTTNALLLVALSNEWDLQMADGGTAVRIVNQCDADGCYAPRKYNVLKGRHFIYCPKHKCLRETCERSHPSWQFHCTTHTCTKSGCNVIVDGEEKLCARHMKCAHSSCPSNRIRKDGEYQPFCSRHTTCTSSQCTRDKKPGSEFCSLHTCPMGDCTKRCIGDHFYCSDHICELDVCRNPRTLYLERDNVVLTRYCPIHECRKLNCHLSARNQTYGYCRAHNCDVSSCNNLKMIDPDSYPPLTMCRKHYDESLDPPPPPRSPRTAAPPAPPPDAITLKSLSSQLSKLQRTADNIEGNSYYDNGGAGVGGGGGGAGGAAAARAAEEAAEARRRLEEVLREQRGVMHSLRQQGAKVNAIWEELVGRRRGFGGQ